MDEVFIRIRNRQPLAAAFGLWGGPWYALLF